jgi:hypothetical protein
MPTAKQMPNAEQLEALKQFAASNGRTWKSALRHAWETGDYGVIQYTNQAAYLQQIRNSFGPSWLVRFVLTQDGAYSVFSSVDRTPEDYR